MSIPSHVHARVDKVPEIKVPSQSSLVALAEIESGEMKQFNSVDELMADLHEDDWASRHDINKLPHPMPVAFTSTKRASLKKRAYSISNMPSTSTTQPSGKELAPTAKRA